MASPASAAFIVTVVALYIGVTARIGRPSTSNTIKVIWSSCLESIARWQGVDELRQRIHHQWMDLYQTWISALAISLEWYGAVIASASLLLPGSKPAYLDSHIFSIISGLAVLRWPSSQQGRWGPRLVTVVTHISGALARLDVPKSLVPMVVLGDVMISFLSADPVFAIWTRILCAPFYITIDVYREFPDAHPETFFYIVVNEIMVCFFMSVILLQGDYLFCKKELATMSLEKQVQQREEDMKELEQFISAARRLLSVMCDSCEQLTHDWKLLQPSQKVLQLLQIPLDADHAPGDLAFLNYVCSEDQERFLSFVKDSTSSHAPSSLHLRMRTSKDVPFDAQLFHVSVPSRLSQCSQHLISISLQQPLEPRCEIQSIPENDLLDVGMAGLGPRASRSPQARPRRRRSNMSDSSSSSGGTSSSQPSLPGTGWALVPFIRECLPEVERVNLLVDLMTGHSGYAIRGATVSFKASASLDKLPRLYNWVKRSHQPHVEDWMQEHLNSWYHQEQLDERCLGIKFTIPGLGATFTAGELVMRSIIDTAAGVAEEDYRLQMSMELRTLIAA